jgi:NAD(P)H-hydrate epimerase
VVKYLLEKALVPLVLDADGLNALAQIESFKKRKVPLIITPHAGELGRLLKMSAAQVQRDRVGAALKAAKKFGAVCVLKGAGTIVTDGQGVWKNTTGNAGLASGGTGDVLTGLVASFWAQSKNFSSAGALHTAALAVYFHGLAGDAAAKALSPRAMSASQMISFFSKGFKMIESGPR